MSSSMAFFITSLRSPFSAHSPAMNSSLSLLSMNQFKYLTMFGWSKDCEHRHVMTSGWLPDGVEPPLDSYLAAFHYPCQKSIEILSMRER